MASLSSETKAEINNVLLILKHETGKNAFSHQAEQRKVKFMFMFYHAGFLCLAFQI